MEKMNLQDALKHLIRYRNMTYAYVANKMGVTLQTVSDRLNKKNAMSVDTLLKMCEATDCELVIRSKMKDKVEWVITEAVADGSSRGRGRPEKEKGN